MLQGRLGRRADAAQGVGRGKPYRWRSLVGQHLCQGGNGGCGIGPDGGERHGRIAPDGWISVVKRLDHVVNSRLGRRPDRPQNLQHTTTQCGVCEPLAKRVNGRGPQADQGATATDAHVRDRVGQQIGKFARQLPADRLFEFF